MIVGKIKVGATPVAIPRDTKAVSRMPLPAGNLPKLSAWLDGLGGGGGGDALACPVVYTVAGALVGFGDTFTIPLGSAARWYDMTFSAIASGLVIPAAASYDVGLIVGGPASSAVRFYTDAAGTGHTAADTFSDGPALTFGTATATANDMTIHGDVFDPWVPPNGELEFYYGRLPFAESQKVLGTTVPVPRSGIACAATWHGTKFDHERGSFVVLKKDGVLDQADLVGERVKISTRAVGVGQRSVVGFVHNTGEIEDVAGVSFELSVPRRLWFALALPGDNAALVTVEKLA